jgi:chromosome segregation ATPase
LLQELEVMGRSTIGQLTDELEKVRASRADLQRQLNEHATASATNSNSADREQQLQREVDELRRELASVRAQSEVQSSKHEDEMHHLQREVEQLTQDGVRREEQLIKKESELEAAQKEVQDVRTQQKQSSNSSALRIDEFEQLKQRVEQLERERTKQDDSLINKETELSNIHQYNPRCVVLKNNDSFSVP